MLVYMAGPVDGVPLKDAQGWRNELRDRVSDLGIVCFDPVSSFGVGATVLQRIEPPTSRSVGLINRMVIRESDAMVVCVNGPVFGTVREIEYAAIHNVPTLAMVHMINVGLEWGDITQVCTMDEAVEWLRARRNYEQIEVQPVRQEGVRRV